VAELLNVSDMNGRFSGSVVMASVLDSTSDV